MRALTDAEQEVFDAWSGAAPGGSGPPAAGGAPASMLGAAAGTPALAYGSLTGSRRDDVLRRDAAVRALAAARTAPASPTYAELLEAFRNSPMTGMTTVLDLARKKSGYNPLGSREEADAHRLRFFVEALNTGLFGATQTSQSFDFDPSTPAADIRAGVARFVGNDPVLAPVLKGQLDAAMGAAVRTPGQAQSVELLMEYNLVAGERYEFVMARSSVQIAVAFLPPMNYLIGGSASRGSLAMDFKAELWPQRAQAVLDQHLKSVTDWLQETSNVR